MFVANLCEDRLRRCTNRKFENRGRGRTDKPIRAGALSGG